MILVPIENTVDDYSSIRYGAAGYLYCIMFQDDECVIAVRNTYIFMQLSIKDLFTGTNLNIRMKRSDLYHRYRVHQLDICLY